MLKNQFIHIVKDPTNTGKQTAKNTTNLTQDNHKTLQALGKSSGVSASIPPSSLSSSPSWQRPTVGKPRLTQLTSAREEMKGKAIMAFVVHSELVL